MVELSEFRADSKAIADGDWERVNETLYGDLEIRSRGFTDDFIDAQNVRMAKAAERYGSDRSRIPNADLREINAGLLREFLVLDVRNLSSDGQPVGVQEFHAMLSDPQYGRLARAAWEAAGRVSSRSEAQLKAARGNSPRPFGPISSGAPSEQG